MCEKKPRAKTILERLNSVKKLSCFEIAALFLHLVCGLLKSAVISKQESFLTELTRSHIVLSLVLTLSLKDG